jgi:penicillin-binding protein 1A
VVKNLLVSDDVTYERKIREMIVASRVESTLSKPEILELYLNSAYLGRGSWGVEMAAQSYFGKSAKNLTLAEGAMLAGLLKGPSFFNPDRHPERAKERLAYVLGRMQDDGVISAEDKNLALAAPPKLLAFAQKHPGIDPLLHLIANYACFAEAISFYGHQGGCRRVLDRKDCFQVQRAFHG